MNLFRTSPGQIHSFFQWAVATSLSQLKADGSSASIFGNPAQAHPPTHTPKYIPAHAFLKENPIFEKKKTDPAE